MFLPITGGRHWAWSIQILLTSLSSKVNCIAPKKMNAFIFSRCFRTLFLQFARPKMCILNELYQRNSHGFMIWWFCTMNQIKYWNHAYLNAIRFELQNTHRPFLKIDSRRSSSDWDWNGKRSKMYFEIENCW